MDDALTILIIIGLLAATVAIGAPLAIATVLIVSWLLQKPRQGWWLMSASRALKALKAQVRSPAGAYEPHERLDETEEELKEIECR